jgi:hypothetical protein
VSEVPLKGSRSLHFKFFRFFDSSKAKERLINARCDAVFVL